MNARHAVSSKPVAHCAAWPAAAKQAVERARRAAVDAVERVDQAGPLERQAHAGRHRAAHPAALDREAHDVRVGAPPGHAPRRARARAAARARDRRWGCRRRSQAPTLPDRGRALSLDERVDFAHTMRRFAAQRVSSLRLESWSLRSTFDTCVSIVLTDRCSRAGDLLVRVAAGEQQQHVLLARGQLVELAAARRGGASPSLNASSTKPASQGEKTASPSAMRWIVSGQLRRR